MAIDDEFDLLRPLILYKPQNFRTLNYKTSLKTTSPNPINPQEQEAPKPRTLDTISPINTM